MIISPLFSICLYWSENCSILPYNGISLGLSWSSVILYMTAFIWMIYRRMAMIYSACSPLCCFFSRSRSINWKWTNLAIWIKTWTFKTVSSFVSYFIWPIIILPYLVSVKLEYIFKYYLALLPNNRLPNNLFCFSCKEPVEPLTLEEVADRCHCSDDVCFVYIFLTSI